MSEVSGRGEFADCRAMGGVVAIMPSVSVVVHFENSEACGPERVFATNLEWADDISSVDSHSTGARKATSASLTNRLKRSQWAGSAALLNHRAGFHHLMDSKRD
jgi:hypothetical protein